MPPHHLKASLNDQPIHVHYNAAAGSCRVIAGAFLAGANAPGERGHVECTVWKAYRVPFHNASQLTLKRTPPLGADGRVVSVEVARGPDYLPMLFEVTSGASTQA